MRAVTMAVEDITVTLPELLDSITQGDEVILTRNQQAVANWSRNRRSRFRRNGRDWGLVKE